MLVHPEDVRRRRLGLFFLLLAGGMLVIGQTTLKLRLEGFVFVIYWIICFIFTALAMLTALLDIWVMRRRIRSHQRDMIQRTIGEPQSETHNKHDRLRS